MPCKFSMIFYGIFEDFRHWKNCRRGKHQATRVEGAPTPLGAPLSRGPLVAPLHLFLHPHTSSSSQKNHHPAQARVLAHFAMISDLLAQSTYHKTAWGDCSLVCDSSNGPISFCSSALFIANFCCWGDPIIELACRIYMVQSSFNAWYSLLGTCGSSCYQSCWVWFPFILSH